VFLLVVALYFVLACVASWLVLFPAGRDFFGQAVTGSGVKLKRQVGGSIRHATQALRSIKYKIATTARSATEFVQGNVGWCLLVVFIIGAPTLFALFASEKTILGGDDVSTRETDLLVTGILDGERLVP
jgi:peptidoglycan L-alanyl-D-glutamate endopeptidase CwlK